MKINNQFLLTISGLFIYPIKSLPGISVSSALVTDRGLQYDRRWMLVNEENSFLTLREYPKMTMLKVSIKEEGLRINSLEYPIEDLLIPFGAEESASEKVTIWNATCEALRVGEKADQWFSEILDASCKLVYMPDNSMRPVDTTSGYAPTGKFTSFADAYPFMMLGEASMNDLNSRLKVPASLMRFRPNIVFSGGTPYLEDEINAFSINQINLTGLENCARCKIPNIDPEKGIIGNDKEPLNTLATYRTQNGKINFGRNVVHTGYGIISVGDRLHLIE